MGLVKLSAEIGGVGICGWDSSIYCGNREGLGQIGHAGMVGLVKISAEMGGIGKKKNAGMDGQTF